MLKDLLLPEEKRNELWHKYLNYNTPSMCIDASTNAASLHTAKQIRDELNKIDGYADDIKALEQKLQWYIHDLGVAIAELEKEAK